MYTPLLIYLSQHYAYPTAISLQKSNVDRHKYGLAVIKMLQAAKRLCAKSSMSYNTRMYVIWFMNNVKYLQYRNVISNKSLCCVSLLCHIYLTTTKSTSTNCTMDGVFRDPIFGLAINNLQLVKEKERKEKLYDLFRFCKY